MPKVEIPSFIGQFGEYAVSDLFESSRFFITQTTIVNGEEKSKSFPINKCKKTLTITHSNGDSLNFVIYMHQGIVRYKDSRTPNKPQTSPDFFVGELVRMLGVNAAMARGILALCGGMGKVESPAKENENGNWRNELSAHQYAHGRQGC